jgi:hypothetical protein
MQASLAVKLGFPLSTVSSDDKLTVLLHGITRYADVVDDGHTYRFGVAVRVLLELSSTLAGTGCTRAGRGRPANRPINSKDNHEKCRHTFWVTATFASASTALLVLTIVLPDWIEAISRIDPDHGDGCAEWIVAGVLALVALTTAIIGVSQWRRAPIRATP